MDVIAVQHDECTVNLRLKNSVALAAAHKSVLVQVRNRSATFGASQRGIFWQLRILKKRRPTCFYVRTLNQNLVPVSRVHSRNIFIILVVNGPARPDAMVRASNSIAGITSAPVPVRKHSSAA
jgi:hypothetical protein